jgi:hypothetical protein
MNILDLNCLLDVDRYQNINIEARSPEAIYANPSSRRAGNRSEFLRQCVRTIPTIDFAHHRTGQIYAQIVNGKLTAWNREIYLLAVPDGDVRATFEMIVMPPKDGSPGIPSCHDRLDPRESLTLGQWGESRSGYTV